MTSLPKNQQLSAEAAKVAKEELRENETERENALKQLTEWVEKNPRVVQCRTGSYIWPRRPGRNLSLDIVGDHDPSFLLRFLRFKKFSLPMAQETLERYLLLRTTFGNLMFYNSDCTDTRLEELIDLGYLFAVPKRDKHGRRIIIARPGAFDPHKYTNSEMCRMHAIAYETLMEDQENQVFGFVHFVDLEGFSFPYLTLFTPREAVRIVKNGERTIPMRHKEVHAVNIPSGLKYVVDFGLALVSEKIRQRVNMYTNIEEMYDKVDRSLLPKEYGGEMPMAEMIKLWKKELLAHRELLLSHDSMNVRLDLFDEAAREGRVSALKGGCHTGPHCDVLTGSFRQLTVD